MTCRSGRGAAGSTAPSSQVGALVSEWLGAPAVHQSTRERNISSVELRCHPYPGPDTLLSRRTRPGGTWGREERSRSERHKAATPAAVSAARELGGGRLLRIHQVTSPQIVRRKSEIGRAEPTRAIGEPAGQMAHSTLAHSAKPPFVRVCKAGVRGSIPLVSTPRTPVPTRASSRSGGPTEPAVRTESVRAVRRRGRPRAAPRSVPRVR